MEGRLAGKSVLVTGAGSGLGKASALLCARAGARVMCADLNLDAAAVTASEITAAGGTAFSHQVDVADMASADALAAGTQASLGRIDALLNFAGISGNGTVVTTTREVWDRVIGINLTGVWLMCRAVIPFMQAQKSGSVVNVSSIAGIAGVPATAPYASAKAGVIGMTRGMAVDFAADNIRTNVICPGTVPTPLMMGHYLARGEVKPEEIDASLRAVSKRFLSNRLGTAEEIAALALYLASDESGFVTGAVIPIDGGASATAWQVGQ